MLLSREMGLRNPQVTRLVETEAAGWGAALVGHGRVWNRHEWVMAALATSQEAGHLGVAGTPLPKVLL